MPRWLEAVLCLVLFTAVMLLARWGLSAWVPAMNETVTAWVGDTGWWAIFLTIMAACGVGGFWPRTPDGRFRPLLPPRHG